MGIFKARCGIWLIMVFFVLQPASARIPSIQEFGRTIPGLMYPGFGGFAVADFDGDGKEDVLVPASNGSAMFVVIGRTGTDIGVKQSVLFPDGYFSRVLVREFGGKPHVFSLNQYGLLREFAGWPLAQVRELDIGTTGFLSMAIGDIDADERLELVVAGGGEEGFVRAYDLEHGTLRWSMPHVHVANVLLQQLDADPALEIVLDGDSFQVIDGATKAVDWSYDGFYISYGLAAGKFQQGESAQFVVAFSSLLYAFRSQPFSPIWNAMTDGVNALEAADLDRDGIDEIIQGGQQWGTINVYSVGNAEPRLRIPHASSGAGAVAGVDLNGGGDLAIAFSPANTFSSEGEIFQLVEGVTGALIWKWNNAEPGPYSRVLLADLQGDGSHKLVYASQGKLGIDGVISQIDAATGEREWRSPPENPHSLGVYSFWPTSVQLVRRKNQPPIVVVGGSHSGGYLVAIDGRSHEVLWHVADEEPLKDLEVKQVQAFDLDADGNDEIVTCVRYNFGNYARLVIFSGRNGTLQWESSDLMVGVGAESCHDLAVGTFDSGHNPFIVAVLPDSIVAFDALNHSRVWTLPFTADGLTLLEQGERRQEFVTFTGSTLRFYDATTRALLRQFDLDAPILAVRQLAQNIRHLVVAAGGHLLIVDGVSGEVLASSEFLGMGLGNGNQLAMDDIGGGTWLIAVGSEAGVFRLFARVTDVMFRNGFDGA